LLLVIGAGAVSGNWVGLAGWTLLVLFPLLYRIHVEENALLSTH
jgi:protein-S-isoprenylcysteine O-methyltransferase Ste14